MVRKLSFIGCWMTFMLIGMMSVQAQELKATVNPAKPVVGRPFQVSFQVSGAQASRLQAPDFGGLQLLGGPSTFANTQIINGQVSQSFSYSYTLRAPKAGTFTIGAATIEVGGESVSSKPISVEVGAAAAAAGNSGGNAGAAGNAQTDEAIAGDVMAQIKENVFLRALVSKSDVYQGEQLIVTYKLYTRAGLSGLDYAESPSFKNFWKEEFDPENVQFVQEAYKGQQYNTAIIKRAILFPQKSGELEINPLKLDTKVQVRTQTRRRRRSVFDDFFGNGGVQEVPYTVSSGIVKIKSRPLPRDGKPADFTGAVGDFNLTVTLDNEEIQTGDAATFSVTLSGKGNIKALEMPKLEFPPDFEVYDPKVDDRSSASSGSISGTKSFDYLVIPRNPGAYKLPKVTFSYFDPVKKRYFTRESEVYSLNVEGEPMEGSVPGITQLKKEDVELIGEDIRFIQTGETELKVRGVSFLASMGFASLYVLPFLLFGALLWYKTRQDRLAGDVAGTRSRKANSMAQKRLKAASEHMKKEDTRAFYGEVSRATWGFLSDKLNISQSELSRENIQERMQGHEVPAELLSRLTTLLDTCEMALFAPTAVTGGMESTYSEALSLISAIDNQL